MPFEGAYPEDHGGGALSLWGLSYKIHPEPTTVDRLPIDGYSPLMDLQAPVKYEDLTADPFELEILNDTHLDTVEPLDPYYREVTHLQSKLASIRARTPHKRMAIVSALLRGEQKKEIIKSLRTSYTTINLAMKDVDCQNYVAAYMRSTRLRQGPTLEARGGMLWRIALREEITSPRTSIAAIDALNKQDGVYAKNDDSVGDSGVKVTVNNFIVDGQPMREVTHQTPTAHIIEGEFSPVTVEIKD
jgi:hypothetical protein